MSAEPAPFAELLRATLAHATPRALGRMILADDPQRRHLDEARCETAVADALADGTAVAAGLQQAHGTIDPEWMAGKLGLPVVRSDEAARIGMVLRLAEYRKRPPEIRLFRRSLGRVDEVLAEAGVSALLGLTSAEPALIAHELYHHVEATRRAPTIARRHRVDLFGIGRWRWRSGLQTLSEVAAGACAQALLGLPYHGKILDLAVIHAHAPERTAAMAARIRQAG